MRKSDMLFLVSLICLGIFPLKYSLIFLFFAIATIGLPRIEEIHKRESSRGPHVEENSK